MPIPGKNIVFPETKVDSEGNFTETVPEAPVVTTTPEPQVDEVQAPEPITPEEFDTIVYNKEEVKIPVKDRQTYLQKGYNYDKVNEKLAVNTKLIERINKWVKENYGEQGVEDWDGFEAALSQESVQETKQELEAMGVDETIVKKVIETHPALQEAVRKAQLYEQESQKRVIEQRMADEVKELNQRFDLTFTSIEEISKLDKANDLIEYAKKGLNLADSYFLTYKDEIMAKTTKKTQQQTLNKLGSKSHLVPDSKNVEDSGDVDIPSETLKLYKELNPSWNRARIIEHYKNNKE